MKADVKTVGKTKAVGRMAGWSRRYLTALRKHLEKGLVSSLKPAAILGRQAVALGLETLDVARLHAQALLALAPQGGSRRIGQGRMGRANRFFAETVVPIEVTHRAARSTDARVHQLTQTLRQRTVESDTSSRDLKRIVIQRRGAEHALTRSAKQHTRLLADSQRLQKHLRQLTRKALSTQEAEMKRTGGQIQDEIAQTLLGIHVRLLTLKRTAWSGTDSLKKEIADTQRLVRQSAKIIKRATRECGIPHEA